MSFDLHEKTFLPAPIDEVFAFFSAAENLEKITPPSLSFRIVTPLPIKMEEGILIDYKLRVNGVPTKWRTLISVWNPPYEFVDEQLKGPYRTWVHTHRFQEVDGGTMMEDHVHYAIPFGPLGKLVAPVIKKKVSGIFVFRKKVISRYFNQNKST